MELRRWGIRWGLASLRSCSIFRLEERWMIGEKNGCINYI